MNYLETVDLSNNQLSGNLPSDFANLPNLMELDLSNNQFTEKIPNALGACGNLKTLNLANNKLEGSIPKQLYDLGIEKIDFSHNKLTDGLPEVDVTNDFIQLEYFNIGHNNVGGSLPTSRG